MCGCMENRPLRAWHVQQSSRAMAQSGPAETENLANMHG
jgi:hypothetical protein